MISLLIHEPIVRLRANRRYRFEKLSGDRKGEYSMHYNDRKVLVFKFTGDFDDGCVVTITEFGDHYGSK